MAHYTITIKTLQDNNFDFGLKNYPIFDETYRSTLNNNILTFNNNGTVQVTISTRDCSKTIAVSYITQGVATKTVSNENRSFDVTYNDEKISRNLYWFMGEDARD